MERFINESYSFVKESGKVSWKSPSNIALVKYWGKEEGQIPSNSSISFTLNSSVTSTSMKWSKAASKPVREFVFEGNHNEKFQVKINKFLSKIERYFTFLNEVSLKFESSNTFPHSAGIASSASSLSSIALCLCTLEKQLSSKESKMYDEEFFFRKASFISRIGSGSACRSVYPICSTWGSVNNNSNLFAKKHLNIDPIFKTYKDAILIVSSEEKVVSSTQGHELMNHHPFKEVRFKNANLNTVMMMDYLERGDLKNFGELLEKEALELHGLMMNSNPSFILMKPNTLAIIDKIRSFRKKSKLNIYFTLDAGPNIHILYPENESQKIEHFIESELLIYTENNHWIKDSVGLGPKQIEE